MSEQLALVSEATAPKLGIKQAFILAALQAAGVDGLHADEAGALYCESRGIHHRDQRCEWDGSAVQTLKSLRKKGLAQYRAKTKRWQAVTLKSEVEAETETPADFDGLRGEYNALPAGF